MRDEELRDRLQQAKSEVAVGVLPIGTVFGGWRLTAFIARGGNADVYCAEHVSLGTAAAVKVLRDEGKESRRERFKCEAKLLSELKSPSFPRFYAYGSSGGCDYLVEELLEPRELPKGGRSAIRFLLALCGAAGELHAHNLVHCDIKPANILFRPDSDVPVLVDLGMAVSASDDAAGGSRGYSAPEQFIGGAITPAADIHALGVLAERLELNFRGIIRRATSSIPSERFKTVTEFSRAIRRRVWGTVIAWVAAGLMGVAAGIALAASWMESRCPMDIHLNGQTMVRVEPLRIKAGRMVRVIGPGTLDAEISGEKGSRLWMTNCVVLNRSRRIYPDDPLSYELAGDVYLNFIASDQPQDAERLIPDYFLRYDAEGNEVRYRGPDTINGLMHLHNLEYFDRLK